MLTTVGWTALDQESLRRSLAFRKVLCMKQVQHGTGSEIQSQLMTMDPYPLAIFSSFLCLWLLVAIPRHCPDTGEACPRCAARGPSSPLQHPRARGNEFTPIQPAAGRKSGAKRVCGLSLPNLEDSDIMNPPFRPWTDVLFHSCHAEGSVITVWVSIFHADFL